MSTTQEIHELIRQAYAIESTVRIRGTDELTVHCPGESARVILAEKLRLKYGIEVISAEIKRCGTIDDVETMVILKQGEKQRLGRRPGVGSFLPMSNFS